MVLLQLEIPILNPPCPPFVKGGWGGFLQRVLESNDYFFCRRL